MQNKEQKCVLMSKQTQKCKKKGNQMELNKKANAKGR